MVNMNSFGRQNYSSLNYLMMHELDDTQYRRYKNRSVHRRKIAQTQLYTKTVCTKRIGNGKIKDLPENRRVDFAVFESQMQQRGVA